MRKRGSAVEDRFELSGDGFPGVPGRNHLATRGCQTQALLRMIEQIDALARELAGRRGKENVARVPHLKPFGSDYG